MSPLALIASAHAIPLVHSGEADPALERVTSSLGPGAWSPVPLSEVLEAPPALRSGAAAVGCAVQRGEVQLAEALDALHSALLYLELEQAEALVASARAEVLCADPPIGAPLLAQLELLDGIRHELADAPQAARARFDAALTYDASVAWDEAFPPDRRGRFDAAVSEHTGATAALQIHPAQGALQIDGQPPTPGGQPPDKQPGTIPAGSHVITVGGHSVRITLEPGATDSLVVPAAYPDDVLSWMQDPDRRADLSVLLAHGLGEGVYAVVVAEGVVWSGTTGRVDWTLHPATPQPVDPGPSGSGDPPRRTRLPAVVAGSGLGAGLVGGALIGAGFLQGSAAVRQILALNEGGLDPDYPDRYAALAERYTSAQGLQRVGVPVAGVGASIGAVGLGWFVRRKAQSAQGALASPIPTASEPGKR